jgi:hypothetical protein
MKKVLVDKVYMKINGEIRLIDARKKIFLTSENEGRLIDGRVVKKEEGRWIYEPK